MPTHLGFGQLLCQVPAHSSQQVQNDCLKVNCFKPPGSSPQPPHWKPPEVNGFGRSLTHPGTRKPALVLASAQSVRLGLSPPAGQASSHPVTLPVLTALTFKRGQPASQQASGVSQYGLEMWSKTERANSRSAIWLHNGH